jgi:lipopolysaccharide biosynthesis glycosyltransferase
MKNAIITMCDAKYGDFLVNHWLPSLQKNVNLKNTDVVVIDYGLTKEQADNLERHDVILKKFKRDGHVTIIRFRDIPKILSGSSYGQIMICDGGDIIFQSDISAVFAKDKEKFRAVCEGINAPFETLLNDTFFSEEDVRKILKVIRGKKMINAGVLVASRENIVKLCREINSLIKDKSKFGPDQLVVNYVLFRDGFKELDQGYNYVVATARKPFYIKDGVFHFTDRKIIPIVHNAGNLPFLRPVKNFGYGEGRNRLNKLSYFAIRTVYPIFRFLGIHYVVRGAARLIMLIKKPAKLI